MLSADVSFEGWTIESWTRFLDLWRSRATARPEPMHARGGIVAVYHAGQLLKLLHTHQGRVDPASACVARDSGDTPAPALDWGQPSTLARLARAHSASWALGMRLGALDEVMERFGARARRDDDLTAQSLTLMAIIREMMSEGAITTWPQRLHGLPVPNPHVVRRTLDALCADGRAIALGLFDAGDLWTAFVARRRGSTFDSIAGPEELRPTLGLLSGDWRRDYRHVVGAIEDRYAPLALGCFGELETFRTLQTRARPGGWARAVAVRDVIVAPVPTAVGVALGLDGARYALRKLIALTERLHPLAALAPMAGSAREKVARLTGKDIGALLGFDPLAALRALLER